MKKIFISILFITAWVLSSCTQRALPEIPDFGIENDHINSEITLVAPDYLNSFEVHERLLIQVQLVQEVQVKIPNNGNAKLYVLDETSFSWIEIQDIRDVGILPKDIFDVGDVILSKGDYPNDELFISLHPNLEKSTDETVLLIFISGTTLENDQIVGAYTIVSIKP